MSEVLCGACGERVASEASPCPACGGDPRLAGRFRLDGVLGRGAGGVTYRATDLGDGSAVAVKEMALGAADAAARERVEREARILRQLAHPAIPRYVDHFIAGSGKHRSLYLVQELIAGETLEQEQERRRYGEAEILDLVDEVLGILEYLHGLRPPVVHRDVKPRNVMRRSDGRLVLLDFGSVRDAAREPDSALTMSGTYGYMAPEQFRGEAPPASDVYAVAVLTITLLSRRTPDELMNARHELDWKPHVQVAPAVAEVLEVWLDPDPTKRPADAGAARADLRLARERGAGSRRRASRAADTEASAPVPVKRGPPVPAGDRAPSQVVAGHGVAPPRNRWTAVALAFALGVVGAQHWYLGNRVAGFFSALFCWTFIPMVLNFVHAVQLLVMSGEEFDRRYNPAIHTLRYADAESFARQLAALHDLHLSGALDEDEYEAEKDRLMALREVALPARRRRKTLRG